MYFLCELFFVAEFCLFVGGVSVVAAVVCLSIELGMHAIEANHLAVWSRQLAAGSCMCVFVCLFVCLLFLG